MAGNDISSEPAESFVYRADDIDWYVEKRGTGPDLVLIPSGEGDCASFATIAADLGKDFTVTTFDTPGFSRSGPPSNSAMIAMTTLSGQIAALVRSLGIAHASFYGCSSGGLAALNLAVDHADLVDVAIVHEAALSDSEASPSPLASLLAMDDAEIASTCAGLYAGLMNEDQSAWAGLGADYHGRLAANYVTWVRRYLAGPQPLPFAPEVLAGRPIVWTIGGLTEVMHFFSNIRLAHRAGIDLGMLPCRHFPQVSVPSALTAHIRAAVGSRG